MSNYTQDFTKAETLNNRTLQDYWRRLADLSLSVFKWEGLPETVNVRFLEQTLFTHGMAGFAYDFNMGAWVALPVAPAGSLTIYNEFTRYALYGVGYREEFPASDLVLIRNNPSETPTQNAIDMFAWRLYIRERAADVNILMQKFPGIVLTTDEKRLTLQNIMMKYDGNVPLVFGNKDNITLDEFKHINFNVPYMADKIRRDIHEIWNEALTFLGIENSNTDKRERLNTAVVESGNAASGMFSEVQLATRQKAAEDITKLLGQTVTVSRRDEGKEYGSIHSDRGQLKTEQV